MPGPAGQSPDYRGVKIVTGATCWRRLRDWHEASVWNRLTDITEFQIPAGKVYLSPVIDCLDGLVVSWSIGTQLDADLANTMLDSAIKSVADCDKQPDPLRPWSALSLTGMTIPDVRCEARSSDNAACEGFFGRLKTELFYPRDWRATTVDQFIAVLDSHIRWYSATRINVSLGSLSPLEYRESLGIAA